MVAVHNNQLPIGVVRQREGQMQGGFGGNFIVSVIFVFADPHHRGHDAQRVHLAYPVVVPVGNVQVAARIDRHIGGISQAGARGRPVIPGEKMGAVTRHRGDDSLGIDLADAVVAPVCDVQIALGIEIDPERIFQKGIHRRAKIAAKLGQAQARHGGDHALGIDLSNAVVGPVGNIQIALTVTHQIGRIIQMGLNGRSVIAPHIGNTGAGHGGYRSRNINPANAVVVAVRHKQVSFLIQTQSCGKIKSRFQCGTVVAVETRLPVTRNGCDDAVLIDFAYAVFGPVRNINISLVIDRHAVDQG